MKIKEKGQGLVEYALLLVLVPIVVFIIKNELGDSIDPIYCEFGAQSLGEPSPRFHFQERMGVNEKQLDILVELDNCPVFYIETWDIYSPSQYGDVENNGYGSFTYFRADVGTEIDDSFIFRIKPVNKPEFYLGEVKIIVGKRDKKQHSVLSEANGGILFEGTSNTDVEILNESIMTLTEQAILQKESIIEGVELDLEGVEEGMGVLFDYARDTQNVIFFNNLSLLSQTIEDGNWDEFPSISEEILFQLVDIPLNVYLAMNLKVVPTMIRSCEVLSDGFVHSSIISDTLEKWEGLDDNHPQKEELYERIQSSIEVIERRNFLIQEHIIFNSISLNKIIELAELAGEYELAEQLAVDSEACVN